MQLSITLTANLSFHNVCDKLSSLQVRKKIVNTLIKLEIKHLVLHK